MITLIWMFTWLPQVLSAELLSPVNTTLTSDHFIHMLKWTSAPDAPRGVKYLVEFITDMDSVWKPVAGCEGVQHPLACNLTEALSNPTASYYIRVKAQLEEQTSAPVVIGLFKPIRDTHLDLPLLTVTPCGRNVCVDFQPHMEHLRKFYDLFKYELKIQTSGTDRGPPIITTSLSRVLLKDLAPGRQYCVSVRFLDDLIPRESNYSQPQCAFTPGVHTADALISGVVCSLLMVVVVILVLLVITGVIFLKRRPLPGVLTSIRHLEEVLVFQPCGITFSFPSNVKATPPSSGVKRSSQTSSSVESDEESETETTAGSKAGGGGYKLRLGTNLLSASSSSPYSTSAPLSPEPVVSPASPSNPNAVILPPEFFSPQPEAPISAAGPNRTPAASLSESRPESLLSPPADSLTVERLELKEEQEEEEEEEVLGDGSSQAVNLLTLTFGRRDEKEEEEEEEEEEEKSHPDIPEVEPVSLFATLILPSQTVDTEEVAIETTSCSLVTQEEEEEEEEDEELSGYMRRPVSDVLQNLL